MYEANVYRTYSPRQIRVVFQGVALEKSAKCVVGGGFVVVGWKERLLQIIQFWDFSTGKIFLLRPWLKVLGTVRYNGYI